MIKKQILDKIKAYDTIIIHGHKRPDGDCYGAQFGLKSILVNSFKDKQVYVVGQTSDFVGFIGEIDQISDDLYQGALAIVVDTATKDRISDDRYTLAKEVIKIDHHIPVDSYGDLEWVDTSSPATAQMITTWFREFEEELSLDKSGAIALYTGIVTDTGRFRFSGVSNDTMCMAGFLLSMGVDLEEIDQRLSVESLASVRLKGYILTHFESTENGVVYVKLPREMIEKFEVSDEKAASVVNLLGTIEGFPTWFLAIEYPDEIRLRIRSRGPAINTLANRFGGGGHEKAAGGKLDTWADLPAFVEAIDAHVKEYKKTRS